eukprot:m.252155 g.252155  ORF g.252155 m.252155 type:complete len:127 (-) comp19556_c1_seq3:135-515(-)
MHSHCLHMHAHCLHIACPVSLAHMLIVSTCTPIVSTLHAHCLYIASVAAASVQDNAAAASNSEKSTKETVASAAPANSSRGPCEDYSVGFQPAAKPADKPTSAAAKKLAKIDKKGMKSMMSFFKKK